MNRDLTIALRQQAAGRCEYCLMPELAFPLPFQIDHIIAEKHGGTTVLDNLALACPHCNRHKGPNIAGLDPSSGQLTRLFNPRRDEWSDHFQSKDAYIVGITAIGRATVQVLAMNAEDLLLLRVELMKEQ